LKPCVGGEGNESAEGGGGKSDSFFGALLLWANDWLRFFFEKTVEAWDRFSVEEASPIPIVLRI
jgi:hypothetical protein